jgi:predicted nucleotidyltransferase
VETARSDELRALARRIADELPPSVEEVVLTGSVSRGTADERSDVEMLVVTHAPATLEEAYAASGLPRPQSWGLRGTPAHRVFGYREGVPVEQIWWSRAYAEERIAAYDAADAIAHGLALRTGGLLERWQHHLSVYPEELARERIEAAALTWGGYAPEAVRTVTRPGERLARVQRMVGDAERIVRIVFALNRAWEPTLKRLAQRVEPLPVKPARLAERLDAAFADDDFLALTGLALETVELAPDGPNVLRARAWLAASAESLRA